MIHGLVAATFTPMHPDGSLRFEQIGPLVEHLTGQGLAGLFLCGSTGEGASLTTRERKQVVEAFVRATDGRLPILVHVGHNSLSEARDLAQHAAEIGADAIALAPPNYFPLGGAEAIASVLEHVAEAAPKTPLYYYHIPKLTRVEVDVRELLDIAATRIPSLQGVKYSDASPDILQTLVADYGDRINFLFGVDEMLMSGMVTGAHGAVGSTYNFIGPLFGRVLAALEVGDLATARELQEQATRLILKIVGYAPALASLKHMLKLSGVDCGPPRLPLRALSAEAAVALEADVRALGFEVTGE